MPKSNFLSTQLLEHILGQVTYIPPSTYYLALCKVAPLASNTGSTITEVTYTNYVRLAVLASAFAAVAAQSSSNSAPLTFATPGTTGDTAYGWALCDASSGGNVHYYGPLPATVITPGIAPFIPAGALVLAES